MTFELNNPAFWEEPKVETELKRVFDICNGCRRCYSLCPSFTDLFARLDRDSVDGAAEKLDAADLRKVTDLCYQCKLCFNHCPYTPPHRWDLDFPRLMLRSKAAQVRRDGLSLQDRILGQVDRMGRMGTLFAPLANWALGNRFNRWLMEKFFGIHRDRILPTYASETFRSWFTKRKRSPGNGKTVVLFYTCTVNFNEPATGKSCVKVLEKNGLDVTCPEQRCCGMPFLDGGDIDAARNNARANVESLHALVKRGFDIVVPGPTCSYMLKHEYPVLLDTEATREVAERTFDICEYLMMLHGQGKLDTRFAQGAGSIAYQIPCHLRAQNIGYKSRDLMQLIPNTQVRLIEKCAAIDGTWGLKRQYYDLSRKVAEPLIKEIRDSRAEVAVSDCPLAGLEIEQGLKRKALHPIRILARAYGFDTE
ncbi:MAG TPA: anaerobic glycerol-3-phosphate dehydrogenase subunit C [Candidatus Binatia bacterium]|jgi:Fe-S oxidoreductase